MMELTAKAKTLLANLVTSDSVPPEAGPFVVDQRVYYLRYDTIGIGNPRDQPSGIEVQFLWKGVQYATMLVPDHPGMKSGATLSLTLIEGRTRISILEA